MTRCKVFFRLLILFSIFVGMFSGVSKALYNWLKYIKIGGFAIILTLITSYLIYLLLIMILRIYPSEKIKIKKLQL